MKTNSIKKIIPFRDFSKPILLNSAFSKRNRCIICKRSNRKMSRISQNSIILAYKKYNIFIKTGSRCCTRHKDKSGLIKEDQFNLIETKNKQQFLGTKILYDYLAEPEFISDKCCIFDKFKNLDELDDSLCFEITRWPKNVFINFSNYINSINSSKGRTKHQLIAIYRYWLTRGIDQKTLAMFKNNTKQQQISHYLNQIRQAINKDFVPHFLGAASRNREFFLKHNTKSSEILHNLQDDKLCIICDGSYTRLEKSSNNEFQYNAWSGQKKDSLIKPFIITCADGYFIDVYGPYMAHANDSVIFEHILKTDKDLLQLLIPKKTLIFLDRGFRDVFNKLQNEYNFIPKIPTCRQLSKKHPSNDIESLEEISKQLTTKETSETRLVTKVRYIVEKQIGYLKNHKALENIRNTIVGHIQVDYRICAAMYNFFHTKICTDGKHAEEIAKELRKKATETKQINKLNFMLKYRLDTNILRRIQIEDINDFVKLKKNHLERKIFLGSCLTRIVKSYLPEFIEKGTAFKPTKAFSKYVPDLDLNNSKILAFEINSRHKRGIIKAKTKKFIKKEELKGVKKNVQEIQNEQNIEEQEKKIGKKFRTKYKIFIQYVPINDDTNSVFINSSKAIKKWICSCPSGKKIAGVCVHVATILYYLCYGKYNQKKSPAEHLNCVLVDHKNDLPSNKPKIIRTKRDFPIAESSSDDESTKVSEDEIKTLSFQKKKKSKYYINSNQQTVSACKNENKKVKDIQHDQSIAQNQIPISISTIKNFNEHIPKWGGEINYNSFKNIKISNTCTIDYFMFALWVLSKSVINFSNNLPQLEHTESLIEIIRNIDIYNWNKAKEIWISKIMKYNEKPILKSISMYGSERARFLDFLSIYQIHKLFQVCKQSCDRNGLEIKGESNEIYFIKNNNKVILDSGYTGKCSSCRTFLSCEINFINNPNFIFIDSLHTDIFVNELPKEITVDKKKFRFLCSTIGLKDHFLGIFDLENKLWAIDDLGQRCVYLPPYNESFLEKRNLNYPELFYKKQTSKSVYFLTY